MNILVISNNYPSNSDPQIGTFVYELIQKFVAVGNNVCVIAPKKITLKKKVSRKDTYGNELAKVYRPTYLSLSNRSLFGFNTITVSRVFLKSAIRKAVSNIDLEYDIIYCHFIASALVTIQALKNNTKPIFVAVGEYKNIGIVKGYYSDIEYFKLIDKISGFIAVSPMVRERLIDLGIDANKIHVEPNSVNLQKFHPRNKLEIRRKLNLPSKAKIVIFVGRFISDKGPLRVLEALNQLNGAVAGIFIGKGPQDINGSHVLLKGTFPHEYIPELMNAADVFILPTLHEGSSNVIVEAMACGLPIIASDIPEIRSQCHNSFAILVDPMDISQIKNAIETIFSDEDRLKAMSANALEYSKQYDLERRAIRILNFMKSN